MRIRIPVPKRVLTAFDLLVDWVNVPVWSMSISVRRFDLLRLDIIVAILFAICVGWYGYTSGAMGALAGGLMFIFMVICALWIWRK
jgi:hypothetical protein